MSDVEQYSRRQQLRATNQQGIAVSTSASAFGAGVGQAVAQTGAQVTQAGDALRYKEQLEGDANAKEAFNGYRRAQRETLNAPQTGYLNRTGANAAGGQKAAETELSELGQRHGEGLEGAALKRYNELVEAQQDQAHGQLLAHGSNESRNYITNQRQSTIDGYVEEAASNWHDEGTFEQNLALALKEQSQLAALQGWDGATQTQAGDKLVSSAYRNRIVMAAGEDPIAANGLFEDARELLTAEDEHALDRNLKGLVRDRQASTFVQQYVVRGGTTGGVADPYKAAVGGAESGNNPNAANNKQNPGFAAADGSASSALGTHQFLRGTYIAEVRKMQAQGGATWAAGLSDNAIAETRTNVAIEGEVFSFFRQGNQRQIEAGGFAVTPESEYAFHHFGDAGGAALMRAARDNPSATMEQTFGRHATSIVKANPQFKNLTAAEAFDWVSNHLGADTATASGQPYFNSQEAYTAALAIQDPDMRAAVMSNIDSMASLQDKARGAGRADAAREAWDAYTETGQTDFSMDVRQRMGQAGWTSFQAAINADQRDELTTNPDTWEVLTRTASSDPKGFAELNLAAHYGNLSASDRRHFITLQENAKSAQRGVTLSEEQGRNNLDFDAVYRAADQVYSATVEETAPASMNIEQRQERLRFQQELTSMAQDFYDREKREPNVREVREMAAVLTLPITYAKPNEGFFGGGLDGINQNVKGSFFNAAGRASGTTFDINVEYRDVPLADRTRITSQLMATNGGELPSPDDIVEAYEQQRLIDVGLPPNVDVSKVPEWLIDAEKGANPDVSDDELVELYQLFLMSQ